MGIISNMTREDYIKVARHLKRHVNELKKGTFNRDRRFLDVIAFTRYEVIQWMHEMIYIMREKQFKGYEEIDFLVDVELPKNHLNYEFSDFYAESFVTINTVLNKLEFISAISINLNPNDAESQLKILEVLVKDFSVAILLFKEHYNVTKNFDNFVV